MTQTLQTYDCGNRKKGLSEEEKESKNRNAAFLAMIPMHFLNGMAINMR